VKIVRHDTHLHDGAQRPGEKCGLETTRVLFGLDDEPDASEEANAGGRRSEESETE
jgi:hypothetical protein